MIKYTRIVRFTKRNHDLDNDDPLHCEGLLSRGRWLDSSHLNQRLSFSNWQPPGCLMRRYKASDISNCLKSRRIIFIGDSTIRDIFWATAKKLDSAGAEKEIETALKHQDQVFTRDHVTLEFIWDPFLNSSKLYSHLVPYRNTSVLEMQGFLEAKNQSIILLGAGLWHARYLGSVYLENFKASIDNLMSFLAPLNSAEIGLRPRAVSGSRVIIAPVQVPLYDWLSTARQYTITPEKVDSLNNYLQSVSARQEVSIIWSYFLMNENADIAYHNDGIHVHEQMAHRKVDVLLNLQCNMDSKPGKTYPIDNTCCKRYSPLNWIQLIMLVASLSIFPVIHLASKYGMCSERLHLGLSIN